MSRLSLPLVIAFFVVAGVRTSYGQQQLGYVDSEMILSRLPEYTSIQQNLDRLTGEWQSELDEQRSEVDRMFEEYQARELLYTNDERKRRREAILQAEEEVERLRIQYFGPQGELFKEQQELLAPLQERILEAVEIVAERGAYDFVFDRSGDFLFLFVRAEHNLTDQVLEELGIETERDMR